MARHYCPNDWSREEFAQRLQDLLELAPTLLPGNSSAHRGPDQVGSEQPICFAGRCIIASHVQFDLLAVSEGMYGTPAVTETCASVPEDS